MHDLTFAASIARACRWRHDGAVIPGGKRGLFPVIATFSLLLLATPAQAAPPTFQAISVIAASTGADVTVTLPAHQAGDILLLIGVVRDQNDTVTVSGWTQMTGSPFDRSTVSRYWIFWKRAASSSETNPVFDKNTTTGDTYVAVINYRGAIATGDPWEVKGAAATGTTDPATCTGITTLSADSLVVAALAGEDNNNSAVTTTGTNPAAYAEHYLESGTGADGMIAFSEAARSTAGATGNVSVDFDTGNPVGWGCMVLALKPTPAATLSSAADQTFTLGDPPTPASTLTVTDASTPTITAAQDIRIRIPATFSMTWDTTVTTVTLGGGAAGKVNATLSAYEDSNRTAVLNVTANFAASDQLTIAGLKFRDFTTTEAADNLELVVAGSGGAAADEDDKTITIVSVDVSSAGSRILNDDASRTPVAAEDDDVTDWNKSTKFLVTIGIQTKSGSGARCENNQGTNKLQWRNVTDAPGTWNNLDTAGGPEMVLFNSANLVDDNALTLAEAQIVGTGTYINGKEAENNDDKSWSRFQNGQHSAVQFAIDPSGGIDGKTYQFRFIVNPGLCDAGSDVMSVSITLAAPPPPSAAGGFNAYETGTAAGAISGVIKTRIAGSTISLDIIALNTARTAILTTFTGTVRVEVLNSSDNTGALDATTGCRASWTSLQTLSDPTFVAGDNGRKTISFSVANSYPDARLRITFPVTSPTITGCSNDNFAIRPDAFASFSVTDQNAQTAGTSRTLDNVAFTSGGVLHKAGRNFTVSASAVNAAGTPAVTTNYAGTPTPTLTACTGAACTSSFGTFSLGAGFSAGQLSSDTATYGEVGSFALQLVDSAFASVDASDGSTATERNIASAVINVGRFVPHHFAVSLNTPQFGTACGAGGFTYIGQSFSYTTQPAITVTAQDFGNNTTTLYTGAWWRITSASVTPVTQAARYSAASGSLDVSGLPAVATDPAIADTGAGTGTLTFSSGTGISFTRTTPAAPFNAELSLALNVIDADDVAYAENPARFGAATAGNGIGFNNGKAMRFGRLRLFNANGSQLISMPIAMQTQYWNGSGFVTNTLDNCTTIALNNIALGNYQKNLNAGETTATVGGAFNAGIGTLRLSAPGAANNGSVDVAVNLTAATTSASCTAGLTSVAGANLTYLQGAWCGATYVNDPTARATFGSYRNTDKFIYQQENF